MLETKYIQRSKKLIEYHIYQRAKGKVEVAAGNDADSLINANFACFIYKCEWRQFMDFKQYAVIDPYTKDEVISCDIAWNSRRVRGYDNHLTCANENAGMGKLINLNNNLFNVSASKNYRGKYAMSSSIMFYALYKEHFSFSNTALRVLLALDGGYKGFFIDEYKKSYINHLERLDLTELIDMLDAYSFGEWEIYALKISKILKIELDSEGYLRFKNNEDKRQEVLEWLSRIFGFEFKLPTEKFKVVERFKKESIKCDWKKERINLFDDDDYVTFAFINSTTLLYSRRIVPIEESWTYNNLTHKHQILSDEEAAEEGLAFSGWFKKLQRLSRSNYEEC